MTKEPIVRKVVALPESTWALIEDFRYTERIPSEAEAVRRLLLQAGSAAMGAMVVPSVAAAAPAEGQGWEWQPMR